jgi:membrane protein implicated in regulation of membrane protease activity
MVIFRRVLGILIIVLSLLLLIAVPPAGIVFLIFGVLLVISSTKKADEWLKEANKRAEERRIQAKTKLQELRKRNEKVVLQPTGETVFIEYEDANGNFSDRS